MTPMFSVLRICLALTFAGDVATAWAGSELGLPSVQVFTLQDYHGHNQNWGAVQGRDGLMYFANRGRVLTYDGTEWGKIPVPDGAFLRGLAQAADGALYVGGVNQLGWIPPSAASPADARVFESLVDHLPETLRDFRDVWSVTVLEDSVCFETSDHLLFWRAGAFEVVPVAEGARVRAGRNEIWIRTAEGGLVVHRGLESERVLEPGTLPALTPVFVEALPAGGWLLGSRHHGLWRVADGVARPWPTAVDALLREEQLRSGRVLADGSLALGLRHAGMVLLAQDGTLHCRLDSSNGLPNSVARAFYEDREGGLWVCLDSGMARIAWPAPVTVFDQRNGIDRNVVDGIVRWEGQLYTSTPQGLLRLQTGGADGGNARFVPVHDERTGVALAGAFRTFLSTAAGLLVAGPDAVYQITGDTARSVQALAAAPMCLAGSVLRPERVYVGESDGVRVISVDAAGWHDLGRIPGIDAEVRSLLEAADGALWVSTTVHGFYRVTFSDDTVASAQVERFPGGQGLPSPPGLVYVNAWEGRPLFCTGAGLFRFDATAQRFTPFDEVGPQLAGKAIEIQGTRQPDHLWLRLGASSDGADAWRERRTVRASRTGEWATLPYIVTAMSGDGYIFHEETSTAGNVLWIGGSEQVLRVDVDRALQPHTLAAPRLQAEGVASGTTLSYARNTVNFTYAAPAFRQDALLRYQTRLIGFETEPSPWSEAWQRTFTNLPEGRYTFEVRAQDSDGVVSPPARLGFAISPPWWRTLWAYLGYVVLALAGISGSVRWRAGALRRRNEQLEQTVAARTAALRASEEHLRQARDAAETASRAKSAFLANMSHELRTPLNAVLGYARMLREDRTLGDVHRQRAGVIDESGSHLLQVINDVLDLSKIEAGKLSLQPEPCDLLALLENVATTFRALAFERGLAFETRFGADLPAAVRVDGQRLRQVLFNLLGNAVKFTERGSVTLTVCRTGDALRFTVEDTGPGIAEEQRLAIFMPFYQTPDAERSSQGTGLGLTICQRIVALMGGALQVESQLGHGSRFWFDAVLPEVAPVATAVRPQTVTGYAGRRRRLLVVDDEEVNRGVLRGLLEPLGFEVAEAAGGEACIAGCRETRPDAVLLDLRMPGINGFDTARRLRELPGGSALVIIAVSASVFEENRQDAIDAGCDDFLPKPIQLERTLATLQRLLNLEWIQAPTGSVPPFVEVPAAAVLAELHHLSLSGEIEALRQRLTRLAQDEPRHAAFAQALDGLAGRFQMKRIRDIITSHQNSSS